jgi:hypothetical protein
VLQNDQYNINGDDIFSHFQVVLLSDDKNPKPSGSLLFVARGKVVKANGVAKIAFSFLVLIKNDKDEGEKLRE